MNEIPEIPEVLLLEGVTAGLTEADTVKAWAKYCTWSLKNFPNHSLGGRSWTRQIAKALAWKVEDEAGQQFAQLDRANDRARQKAAEDAEYAKSAVTFPDWVAGLQARTARGDTLPVWEQLLVKFAELHPGCGLEEFGGWYAKQMDLVRASRRSTVYVSPEEQRRGSLEELSYLDERGGT
jgi:hypothetical protein